MSYIHITHKKTILQKLYKFTCCARYEIALWRVLELVSEVEDKAKLLSEAN